MQSCISTLCTEDIPCYHPEERQKGYFKQWYDTLQTSTVEKFDYSLSQCRYFYKTIKSLFW